LKQSARQGRGGDVTDKFNLNLLKQAKILKARFPNRTGLINKAFKDRGFVDPRKALLEEQGAIEDAVRLAEAKRTEELLDTAQELGVTILKEDGTEDREATLQWMRNKQADDAAYAERLKVLGLSLQKDGSLKSVMRKEYVLARPGLQRGMFNTVASAMRPLVVQLQTLAKTAKPEDVPLLKAKLEEIVQQADQLRLFNRQTTAGNLSDAEREDHTKFVEGMISDLTRGIVGVQASNDLNAFKTAAMTLDIMTQNAGVMNARDLPTISRLMALGDRNLVSSMISQGIFVGGNYQRLGREVGNELLLLGKNNTIPPVPVPKNPPVETSENGLSDDEKTGRIALTADVQQSFIKRGIVCENEACSYSWLMTQGPALKQSSSDTMSPNDIRVNTKMMLSPNYTANLNRAMEDHPETAAKIGAHAFDVVERNLLNLSRELRGGEFAGRLGADYTIEYDASERAFKIKDVKGFKKAVLPKFKGTEVLESRSPQTPAQRFERVSAIADRVKTVNESLPLLLRTKSFKPNLDKISDNKFITEVGKLLVGEKAKVEDSATESPQVQSSLELINKAQENLKVSSKALLNIVTEDEFTGDESTPDMFEGVKRALTDLGLVGTNPSKKKVIEAFRLFKAQQEGNVNPAAFSQEGFLTKRLKETAGPLDPEVKKVIRPEIRKNIEEQTKDLSDDELIDLIFNKFNSVRTPGG
ncbi:MAG: hypothetical protein ACXABY_32305, partial [Candidatus Thorarchaeota archaeon]